MIGVFIEVTQDANKVVLRLHMPGGTGLAKAVVLSDTDDLRAASDLGVACYDMLETVHNAIKEIEQGPSRIAKLAPGGLVQ